MRDRMMVVAVACVLLLGACKNNAKACYEEGDNDACRAVCETGKPENDMACYEMRARALEKCVDGKADCTDACQAWKNAKISTDTIRNYYVAKLGSEAKVATANTKCGVK